MKKHRRVYLLSNGFQAEYEIAFANGLYAVWKNVVLVASDNTLVDRAISGLSIVNWRGSQKEGRSASAKAANLMAYWGRVARAMWLERDAVFHFNGLFAFRHPVANLVEALAIRMLSRHWWYSVHNIVPHDRDTPLRRRVNRLIYRMPNHLVVHTPRMKDELACHWGIDPARIVCIRHGIDRPLEADAAMVEKVKRVYGLQPQGRPVLLCFGNIAPYKGADLMLEALPLARCRGQVAVVVLGRQRDRPFFDRLMAFVKAMPADVSVQVIDAYVADDDVAGVLGLASAMVLPYRHIDQSGVLFTARAARLPVIATPVGSMGDELIEGIDHLAADCTALALAQAMDEWFDKQADSKNHGASSACTRNAYPIEDLMWRHTLSSYRDALLKYS